jgi:hypothetical protein
MKKLHTSMTLEKFDSSVCLLKNPLEVDGKKGQHVVDRIELVRKKNWLPGEGRAASERSEKVVRSEESQDTDRKDSQRDVLSDERPTRSRHQSARDKSRGFCKRREGTYCRSMSRLFSQNWKSFRAAYPSRDPRMIPRMTS